jgi:uncharacterized membrane protein
MRPLTVENPFEDRYHLCFKCFENTVKTIHKLKKGFIEDLPLYISHNNIFIKEYAIRKIKELNDGH